MESGLTGDGPNQTVEGSAQRATQTMSELFNTAFPQYLAMGMSYAEFWEQDPTLTRAYRKAQRLKLEMANTEAWLHGLYIYEALCDVAPILHAFAKGGTKARPYPDTPHAELIRAGEEEKPKTKAQERTAMETKTLAAMQAMAAAFNRGFERRKAIQETGRTDGAQQ